MTTTQVSPGLGTAASFPGEIGRLAHIAPQEVVAWTTFDEAKAADVDCYACGQAFGQGLVLPCFWPFLLVLSPCLLAGCAAEANRYKAQYWVLTREHLKVVTLDHDRTCLPGLCRSGLVVNSIPLERIIHCGTDAKGEGAFSCCDLPNIYVDDAQTFLGTASFTSSGEHPKPEHKAFAVAFKGHAAMAQAIASASASASAQHHANTLALFQPFGLLPQMQQQHVATQPTLHTAAPTAVPTAPPLHTAAPTAVPTAPPLHTAAPTAVPTAVPVMEMAARGPSAQERLQELTALYNSGLLTQQDFDTKKQDILNSI